jgi:hypothetical protein
MSLICNVILFDTYRLLLGSISSTVPFLVNLSLRTPPAVFGCLSVDDTDTLALTTADSKSAALIPAVNTRMSSERDWAGLTLAAVGVLGSIWSDTFWVLTLLLQIDPRTPTAAKVSPAQSRSDDIRVLTAGINAADFESAVVSASVSVSSTDKQPKTAGGVRRERLTRKGTVEDIDPKSRR